MPPASLADPLALEWRHAWRARLARWRADRVSTATLALVWLAALAVAAALLAWLAIRAGTLLLELPVLQPAACALLTAVAAFALVERSATATAAQARLGWLAALPTTTRMLPRWLLRRCLLRAALLSALLLCAPHLLALAAETGRPPAAALAGWLLLAAIPWPAALLAALLVARREPRQLQGSELARRAAAGSADWLPVGARWQWARFVRDQRGRTGAWMLAPLLLALPAGLSTPATLLALAAAVLVAALLTLWRAAIRTIPRAAALLRATPWPPAQSLRALLGLPAVLWLALVGALAPLLAVHAGPRSLLPLAVLAGAALLHAAATCAERHRPRRIGPLLALHAALQLALLQALPPLAIPLLLVQLATSARQALRR